MDASLKFQHYLCATCQGVLLIQTCDPSKRWVTPEGQTFRTFKDAVDNKCIICSVVWHRNRQYHAIWTATPETWNPITFRALKDMDHESVINLRLMYFIPLSNKAQESTIFRLVLIHDAEYKKQIDFPILGPTVPKDAAPTIGLPWLTHCQLSHSKCGNIYPLTQVWHPTRLLDIGVEGCTHWRLYMAAEDAISTPAASYLTLSYRWGLYPRIRLLSWNFESFRQGQPISDLPILFRDVIDIARQFSIRYVWIDALCIIQDSKDDWEREAPTMRHIYSNSACTIAASGSESPDDSLFLHDRNLDLIRPGRIHCSLFSDKPRPFYIFDKSYWDRQIFDGPLHNRGWVFQERYLSPRVLYFGRNQLLWECCTQHRCEVFPEGIPLHWSTKERDSLIEQEGAQKKKMTLKTFNLWNELIKRYSECDLTLPSDKLHAMAGIAKLFEEATGDEYLAGLWKSRFVESLNWHVYDPKPSRSLGYRAPSWSWAAIDGAVTPHGPLSRTKLLVELVRATVVTKAPDRMSTILTAIAVLKARIIPAVFSRVDLDLATIQAPTGEFTVPVRPDTTDVKLIAGHQFAYLPLSYLSATTGRSDRYVTCLILERDTQSAGPQDRYRRLGSFSIGEEQGHDIEIICFSAELKEIEII